MASMYDTVMIWNSPTIPTNKTRKNTELIVSKSQTMRLLLRLRTKDIISAVRPLQGEFETTRFEETAMVI